MTQLSKNFSLAELTKTSAKADNTPSAEQIENLRALCVNVLQPLREAMGRPMRVNSGFRSDAVNRAVGGSSTSQHSRGEAADIEFDGFDNLALGLKIMDMKLPFDQLIFEFLVPGDPNGGWIHVSHKRSGKQRGQVLTASRVGGKTVYTPGPPPAKK
jgi:zinc D-Ala-D-Ala carboxypeptidase